jgi:hypothetical protein
VQDFRCDQNERGGGFQPELIIIVMEDQALDGIVGLLGARVADLQNPRAHDRRVLRSSR